MNQTSIIERRITLAMGTVLVLAFAVEAQSAIYGYLAPYAAEPADHASFVRDDDLLGSQIVAWDSTYASDLRRRVTAGSVDSVFTQCFGGGFLDNIRNRGLASYTAASAARFNEAAISADNVSAYFDSFKSLDNFTRAYRDAALARPATGMEDWWQHAVEGNDGVTRDPYAIMGAGTLREHPVYVTPDEDLAVHRANNSRTLQHTAGAGNANQYAIMVAWDEPEDRHAVNIARMYDLLRDTFNVPYDNIVILYGNSALNDYLGDWRAVDSNAEYDAVLSGSSRRENWLAALRGELFSTNGTTLGGNRPDANDKLFIFNTGHGGHARRVDGAWVADDTADNVATSAAIDLRGDGFSFDAAPATEEASSMMNDPLGAGSILLQLLLTRQINSNAMFTIPGVGAYSAGASLVLSPSDIYHYNGVLDDPLVAYQFSVPFVSLASVANAFEMQIDNLDSQYRAESLVSALSFFGGDQEQAYLFAGKMVPEPSSIATLCIGMLLMMRRKFRRVSNRDPSGVVST
jgi:hypothetical protein